MTTTHKTTKVKLSTVAELVENIQALTKEIQELYRSDSIPLFWATRGRIQPQYCSYLNAIAASRKNEPKTIHAITRHAGRESIVSALAATL